MSQTSKYLIVEKTKLNLTAGTTQKLFALCGSEQDKLVTRFSLTFEGFVSEWTADRDSLVQISNQQS
jgi:hypothetical protein